MMDRQLVEDIWDYFRNFVRIHGFGFEYLKGCVAYIAVDHMKL